LLDSLIKGLFEGADTRAAFRAAGAIYVRFAVEQPGYFRVMYGPTRLTAGYTADLDTLGPREMARYEAIIAPLCEGRSARGAVIAGWALVHGVATLVADGRLGPGMFGLADDDYEGLVRTITSSYLP
ncbi:MAG: WHG domain-containing protein, partial [Myxococcales bacterium]|nr:WHG domain-containing protein [Myxococcales bacterium]